MFKGRGLRDQLSCMLALLERIGAVVQPANGAIVLGNANPDKQRIEDAKSRIANKLSSLQREAAKFLLDLGKADSYDQDDWKLFSGLRTRCQAMANDIFDLERTVALRTGTKLGIGIDDLLIYEAADVLIEGTLSRLGNPRSSFVSLSDAEHFQAASSAVHLSWTRLNFWHLNRTVHETAHLWAEEYVDGPGRMQRTFADRIAPGWAKDLAKELFAKELFADALATYVAGPAYAYACLFLDFDPSDRKASETHPASDERAYCVLIMLERLVKTFEPTSVPYFEDAVDRLRTFWSESRSAAGGAGEVFNQEQLRAGVEMLAKQLDREVPAARYSDLAGAYQVKVKLEHSQKKNAPAGVTGVDVLNGAWLCRLASKNGDEYALGRAATTMIAGLRGRR